MKQKMNIGQVPCLLFLMTICHVCTAHVPSFISCTQRHSPTSGIINSLSSHLIANIKEDNFIFSPLSLSVALAMVYMGTRGETRDQMIEALNYAAFGRNCLNNKIGEHFKNLTLALENGGNDYSFLVANGVFIHSGYRVSESYTYNLKKYFDSDVQFLSFARQQTLSMEKINQWAADHTKGKITKLLNEPLDSMTVMVLLNAVYFKGFWKYPFPESSTWNSFFYGQNGTSKIVPFMMLQETFNYYHDEKNNHTFVELDYVGGNMSMLLFLPSIREFPQMALTSEDLCKIQEKFELQNVMVVLPKFRMEYKRELSKDMMKLGIGQLFSDNADLSGIREENDLHLSLMVHKAVIDVNERGSEASAISGAGIASRKKPAEQKTFWADHPFMIHILDKRSNTVIFAGRVADPLAETSSF